MKHCGINFPIFPTVIAMFFAVLLTPITTHAQEPGTRPCPPEEKPHHVGKLPDLLGKPTIVRSNKMIVDFSLDSVAPASAKRGRGGITTGDRAIVTAIGNCTDSPTGDAADLKARATDDESNLTIEVTEVSRLGLSSRGWTGIHCAYRIFDVASPNLYAQLTPDHVPALNELTGVVRSEQMVYAVLQYNGYAKDIGGKGNRVLAMNLCTHELVWTSDSLTSNAAILLYGDYLITGYGFSSEKRYLFVLDRWTGAVVQKIPLPKSPDELRLGDGSLYVRLYDGYATFPIVAQSAQDPRTNHRQKQQ